MHASLLGYSLESLIIDNDIIGATQRTIKGIDVSDEKLSFETIKDVCLNGPGHYLGSGQTLQLMQTDYLYPAIGDRRSPNDWTERGALDIAARAAIKVKEILAHHYPHHVSDAVDAEIRRKFPVRLPRAAMQPPQSDLQAAIAVVGGKAYKYAASPAPGALGSAQRLSIPNQASVVIIGGGVAGCSIAYHLTKLGVRDVVLLERRQLTCGTTWHAAGLVGQLRATRNLTELAKYTAELYRSLGSGDRASDGLSPERIDLGREDRRRVSRNSSAASAWAACSGSRWMCSRQAQIKERWPLLEVDDLVGGIFIPKDGQTNPIDTTQALAKGAKQRGARIFENTKVERIRVERGRAVGVDTESGFLRADTVILAGGMWSRELAGAAGVAVPLHAAEHFYIVTEADSGHLPDRLPVLRVQDECAYYKEDAGKLLMGCFEPVAKPWGMKGIPEDFCFDTLPEDPDHFEPILSAAVKRVPVLGETGIALFFNGPESFTPDDRYYVGEAPEVRDCSLRPASIRSASPRAAASARSSRSGSSIANRRWTWPMSTFGA
jgi:glycine/D-amino acid oxidase-like deaminating enzyme